MKHLIFIPAVLSMVAPDAPGNTFSAAALVVRGVFDPTGQKLIRLTPVFRYPWLSQPTRQSQPHPALGAQPFAVQVVTVAGQRITVPFDARVADDSGQQVFGSFEVIIPVQGEVSSVQITDATGQRTFGTIVRSPNPVSVNIVSPRPGARLDPLTKVVARVINPKPGALFQAAYSWDGGQSFVPIAVDLTDPNFTFDATTVPPSNGTGLIRIFAGDGLNTTFADVANLTTSSPQL